MWKLSIRATAQSQTTTNFPRKEESTSTPTTECHCGQKKNFAEVIFSDKYMQAKMFIFGFVNSVKLNDQKCLLSANLYWRRRSHSEWVSLDGSTPSEILQEQQDQQVRWLTHQWQAYPHSWPLHQKNCWERGNRLRIRWYHCGAG